MLVGVLSMVGLGFQPVGVPVLGAGAAYEKLLENIFLLGAGYCALPTKMFRGVSGYTTSIVCGCLGEGASLVGCSGLIPLRTSLRFPRPSDLAFQMYASPPLGIRRL